jgi:hypothetical protein
MFKLTIGFPFLCKKWYLLNYKSKYKDLVEAKYVPTLWAMNGYYQIPGPADSEAGAKVSYHIFFFSLMVSVILMNFSQIGRRNAHTPTSACLRSLFSSSWLARIIAHWWTGPWILVVEAYGAGDSAEKKPSSWNEWRFEQKWNLCFSRTISLIENPNNPGIWDLSQNNLLYYGIKRDFIYLLSSNEINRLWTRHIFDQDSRSDWMAMAIKWRLSPWWINLSRKLLENMRGNSSNCEGILCSRAFSALSWLSLAVSAERYGDAREIWIEKD